MLEMAIVLAIIGIITGGVVSLMLQTQKFQRVKDTDDSMDIILEHLMGYALVNGRLPAADVNQDGWADAGQNQGNLPWKTLGLNVALSADAWGKPFIYHVDEAYMGNAIPAPPDTASGLQITDSEDNPIIASNPIVVLVSFGTDRTADLKNGEIPGQGENEDGDNQYIYPFLNDQVRWLSRYRLLVRLVDAGVWP